MDTLQTIGSWNLKRNKLKQKFAIYKDNNLIVIEGKKNGMFGKSQIREKNIKRELYNILETL